jgi:uncharacterized membrane protein
VSNDLKPIFTVLFASVMMVGGAVHFVLPEVYMSFFPTAFPAKTMIYASGVVEIMVGICALTPRYRAFGTSGILVLMLFFLPLHFLDLFRASPVVGSRSVAYWRFFAQFILIAWAWWIAKK